MGRLGLSEKEQALIAQARREAAARSAQAAGPVPGSAPRAALPPLPASVAAAQPEPSPVGAAAPSAAPRLDPYEQAARLIQAERRESVRRKALLQRTGTAVAAVFIAPMLLFAVLMLVQMLR